MNKARGTTFNLIRELRNHGLIDREGIGWSVPETVLDALDRSRLGDYVRQQLLRNSLVTDLLSYLQGRGALSVTDLPFYLKQRFPFVDASTNTWADYAGTLLSWLKLVRLVTETNGTIEPSKEDRATAAREIGNLKQRYMGVRVSRKFFLPAAFWSHVETLYNQGPALALSTLTTKQRDAFRSLVELGCATPSGQLKHATIDELKRSVRVFLEAEPYKSLWVALASGGDLNSILVEEFQLRGLESSTLHWRRRLLTNWGRAVGILGRRKYQARARDPLLPFDTDESVVSPPTATH